MSTSVLPQLMEVDSELSAQAATLEAQLTELHEKRKGIQTVISMFESGSAPNLQDIAAMTSGASSSKTAVKAKTATKPGRKTGKRTASKTATKGTKPKAKRGRPAKVKVAKATAPKAIEGTDTAGSKRSGRTADWQRYVQQSYRKAPLPDVIGGVLQAQPGNVFKIADVMNAVFKEDMPKNHFLKARNRVSNILSAGARDGNWYRGRGGTYSVSEKAVAG